MHDTSTLLLPTADRFVGPGGRPSDGLPEVGEIRLSEVADVAMDETLTTLGRSIGRTVVGDSLTWIDKGKASYASMAARNNGVSVGTGLFVTQSMNKKETVHNKQSEPTENELYGPWMTVDTRHRRSSYVLNNRGGSTKDSRSKLEVGSRFASLVKEDSTVLGKEFRRRTSPQLQ
ncbi:hypothetical protein V6N13_074442 [Hibiscus sabdariffa]